jgi:beta-xylosidase
MMYRQWIVCVTAGILVGMSLMQGCGTPPVDVQSPKTPPPPVAVDANASIDVNAVPDVNVVADANTPIAGAQDAYASSYRSTVWVGDYGDGTYKNPIIWADYSDPDVCRVGTDYYMTAASFSCMPGLPILHSKDLVNWELIGHALPRMFPEAVYNQTQHGGSVWAPSIRHHQGNFYIYWGDPDLGICMVKAAQATGPWSRPEVVKPGRGLIDACPLWDDDGQVYLIHAWSASHSEISSLFTLHRMNPEGTRVIDEGRHVFDGHVTHPASEGAKFYKHQGYYYIMASCSGPSHGWQVALRSKHIYGPYQDKIVLIQGNTDMKGPHQGAWVQTDSGESWFIHTQEREPFGRVVCLEPSQWVDGWPVVGVDNNGNGCGEPVQTYTKPEVGGTYPIVTPEETDEFNQGTLGLQWQWCANPDIRWSVMLPDKDYLRLIALEKPEAAVNLWDVPNLLLQRMPAPVFTATTKMTFSAPGAGRQAGIIVFGRDYAYLGLSGDQDNFTLSKVVCENAHKGGSEQVASRAFVGEGTVHLRVSFFGDQGQAQFSYSLDGDYYIDVGDVFNTREGSSVGAKVGLFCTSEPGAGRGGYADFDWFRIEE